MRIALVVVRAFADYGPGDVIEAPDTVEAVLAGEQAMHVVRVERPAAAAEHEEG